MSGASLHYSLVYHSPFCLRFKLCKIFTTLFPVNAMLYTKKSGLAIIWPARCINCISLTYDLIAS